MWLGKDSELRISESESEECVMRECLIYLIEVSPTID